MRNNIKERNKGSKVDVCYMENDCMCVREETIRY